MRTNEGQNSTMDNIEMEISTYQKCSVYVNDTRLLPENLHHFHHFLTIITIFLIIFGTIGNLLSIAVLRHPDIGFMPPKIYLITLAVVDVLCVDTGMVDRLLLSFNINIRHWNEFSCKIGSYYKYVLFGISYWLQVAISIDRCTATTFPFKYQLIKGKQRGTIVAGIVCFFIIFECPTVIYRTLGYKNANVTKLTCLRDLNGYTTYLLHYWPWLDFILSFVVPFLIMVFCSVIMIRHLTAARRASGGTGTMSDAARRTTKLFIALNAVFIITNFPKRMLKLIPTVSKNCAWKIAWQVSWIFMLSNHAVNFVFYVVHMPKFRDVLKKMFRSRKCCVKGEEYIKCEVRYSKTSQTNVYVDTGGSGGSGPKTENVIC